MSIKITLPDGRTRIVTEEQLAEWLDDVAEDVDEMMLQPLTITHPLACCAPETIRERATFIALSERIANEPETTNI